jgi:hypothetical protein
MSVRAAAQRLVGAMVISNNFRNETETARFDWLNPFLQRNPELNMRQAESLPLATD